MIASSLQVYPRSNISETTTGSPCRTLASPAKHFDVEAWQAGNDARQPFMTSIPEHKSRH